MEDEQCRNLQASMALLSWPRQHEHQFAAILAPTGVRAKYGKLCMWESKMHVYSSQTARSKQKKQTEVSNDHLVYSPRDMEDEQSMKL
jgi:hypothetical protein